MPTNDYEMTDRDLIRHGWSEPTLQFMEKLIESDKISDVQIAQACNLTINQLLPMRRMIRRLLRVRTGRIFSYYWKGNMPYTKVSGENTAIIARSGAGELKRWQVKPDLPRFSKTMDRIKTEAMTQITYFYQGPNPLADTEPSETAG